MPDNTSLTKHDHGQFEAGLEDPKELEPHYDNPREIIDENSSEISLLARDILDYETFEEISAPNLQKENLATN